MDNFVKFWQHIYWDIIDILQDSFFIGLRHFFSLADNYTFFLR
jgi:hypothetical protein